jgi:hypothetical protein
MNRPNNRRFSGFPRRLENEFFKVFGFICTDMSLFGEDVFLNVQWRKTPGLPGFIAAPDIVFVRQPRVVFPSNAETAACAGSPVINSAARIQADGSF